MRISRSSGRQLQRVEIHLQGLIEQREPLGYPTQPVPRRRVAGIDRFPEVAGFASIRQAAYGHVPPGQRFEHEGGIGMIGFDCRAKADIDLAQLTLLDCGEVSLEVDGLRSPAGALVLLEEPVCLGELPSAGAVRAARNQPAGS